MTMSGVALETAKFQSHWVAAAVMRPQCRVRLLKTEASASAHFEDDGSRPTL